MIEKLIAGFDVIVHTEDVKRAVADQDDASCCDLYAVGRF